jgi:deoxyribodipyrimidine photo-lyase
MPGLPANHHPGRTVYPLMTLDLFGHLPAARPARVTWAPTRAAALERLAEFLPKAGRAYAATRNQDRGPDDRSNVSALSPWIKRRILTEPEVIAAVLKTHGAAASEKFVQEVFWRTYWKGWLEQRPGLLTAFNARRLDLKAQMAGTASLLDGYTRAIDGKTGIACFDTWARELRDTGWLHNHARMWFASIWCFTLRLPWVLGADFFYKHLLDADAASNTLSWRWVAGLHTTGKHYLARPENIRLNTNGRFDPAGQLNVAAAPLVDDLPAISLAMAAWQPPEPPRSGGPSALLLHDDDLGIGQSWPHDGVKGVAVLRLPPAGDPDGPAARFSDRCADDAAHRASVVLQAPADVLQADDVAAWAKSHQIARIVTPYAPAGLTAWALAELRGDLAKGGVELQPVVRPWDRAVWPHTARGFFQLKNKIPFLLNQPEILT